MSVSLSAVCHRHKKRHEIKTLAAGLATHRNTSAVLYLLTPADVREANTAAYPLFNSPLVTRRAMAMDDRRCTDAVGCCVAAESDANLRELAHRTITVTCQTRFTGHADDKVTSWSARY